MTIVLNMRTDILEIHLSMPLWPTNPFMIDINVYFFVRTKIHKAIYRESLSNT